MCDYGGERHGGAQRQSARACAAARRRVPRGQAAPARQCGRSGCFVIVSCCPRAVHHRVPADPGRGSGRLRQDDGRRPVARPDDRAEPGLGVPRRRRQRPGQDLDPHRHGSGTGGCVFVGGAASLVAPSIVATSPTVCCPRSSTRWPRLRSRSSWPSTTFTSSAPTSCHEQVDFLIEHLPPAACGADPHPGRPGPAARPAPRRPAARRDPCRSPVLRPRTRRRPC